MAAWDYLNNLKLLCETLADAADKIGLERSY